MTLPAVDKLMEQTHLERIGPKGWLRYVFLFELPEDYDINEVSKVLRAGYYAAAERLPVMICEAVPDTEAQRMSRDYARQKLFRSSPVHLPGASSRMTQDASVGK